MNSRDQNSTTKEASPSADKTTAMTPTIAKASVVTTLLHRWTTWRPSEANEAKATAIAATVAKGSVIGLFSRWATWPLENAYYVASNPTNKKRYPQIYRETFQPASLYDLNKIFIKAGLVQTVARSCTNIGTVAYINRFHNDLSSYQKGLLTAAIGTPPETLATFPGEYSKIQRFLQKQKGGDAPIQKNKFFSAATGRVISACFLRNFSSNLLTFTGIYKATEVCRPFFPKEYAQSSLVDAIIAGGFAFGIQPFIMPFLNFQTAVCANPDKPLKEAATKLITSPKDMIRGVLGRSICQSARHGINFFALSLLSKAIQPTAEAAPAQTKKLTKS